MALINCSISTESVTAPAGTTDLATQTLVITPNLGYVVSAAAFTNNTSSHSNINSIVLSNSTTANAVGNVVNVVVDLTDSFAMPSSNSTITIDIDGTAIFPDTKPQFVNGTWDAVVGSNVTPVTSSGNAYSGIGSNGEVVSLFTQTFTCASGKFFSASPSVVVTTGNASDYNIHPTNGYTTVDGSVYHTSVTYVVSYTMTSFSVSGNNIDFSIPAAQSIPVEQDEISAYSISTTPIASYGEGRILRVYGTVAATFNCSIVNEDNYFYNFTTDLFQSGSANTSKTINSLGYVDVLITFPVVTDDDTYTITLTATGSSTLNITQTHPIVIQQLAQRTITWSTASASNRSYTALPTYVVGNPIGDIVPSRQDQTFTLTVTDDVGFKLLKIPAILDSGLFTNTNIGESTPVQSEVLNLKIQTNPVYSSGMSAVTSLAITIGAYQYFQGTTNSNLQINLDDFINVPPVANALSTQQIPNNTATTMQLVGTDSQSQTLTYSIVSQGSKGNTTVVGSTGVATYTPSSSSSSGGDSFTFKVNDGIEDSNTATASVNITAASNTAPVATAQSSVPIANNTPTLIQLAGTDADGNSLTYAIVSQGSKGSATVVSSSGVATYTPSSASSVGNDSFTFKVNDGTVDSSAATVGVVIAVAVNYPVMNTAWSWNDSEVNSNYSLIGSSSFQGTPSYTNSFTAGSSSFKANVASWALDQTHVGYPAYCDNLGDIGVTWAFKYNGTTLTSGVAGINSGTSSINQSARTGNINLTEITVAVPSSHNSGGGLIAGGGYTFNYQLRYELISQ
tara:strand:+ start:1475 stop:3853 length:2379 start_codon:yes stop_codon:yes gene_type:complete